MTATAHTPPQSMEAEQATLAVVLLSGSKVLPVLTLDVGLRPDHFYREWHQQVFEAALALHDAGEPVDVLTVAAELKRRGSAKSEDDLRADVDVLTAAMGSVAGIRAYAERIVELAELRQKQRAAYGILEAVQHEDRDGLALAEGLLAFERPERGEVTADALADELFSFMDGEAVETWPLPFERLTRLLAGGFRRGESTVLSGHSSHGKSVVAGMMAETVARELRRRDAGRVRVYVAEGSCRSWGLRFASRFSQLNYGRLVQGKLREGEHVGYLEAIEEWRRLGIVLVPAHGWSPEQIARDVKRHRPAFWAVDLLNELDVGKGDTSDWDRAVRILTSVPEQTDSHLLLLAHVNEARSSGSAKRPKPSLGDLRSTGMLKNAADQVIFVFREQDDDGEPTDDSEVYVRKARDAQLGSVGLTFEGRFQRFVAAGP